MGLFEEKQVFFQVTRYTETGHSQAIFQYLEKLLQDFDLASNLEAVVIGLGPGFFTGVKIASMIGKGIAYAWRKPLYGFSTLEIMASRVLQQESVAYELLVPVVLHKKNELFWMELPPHFPSLNANYHIHVGPFEQLLQSVHGKRVLFVTPWEELKEYFEERGFSCYHPWFSLPSAENLAVLYFLRRHNLSPRWEELFHLVPFYGSKLFEA